MSAIITHRFRKNNVQNVFDEMVSPKVMISGCNSTGTTVTPSAGYVPANLQIGMAVTTSSGTGTLSTSMTTIVTSISTTTFQIYPQPTVALSSALLSFYSQYYVGIGKSDPYNGSLEGSDQAPLPPIASRKYEDDARNNLIALQKVSVALNTGSASSIGAIVGNAGYVLPRYNWTSGNYYKAWDSSDPSCFYPSAITAGTQYPCFVVYSNKVYICVSSGYDDSASRYASTDNPSTYATVMGTVGATDSKSYRWVYVSDLALDTSGTIAARALTASSNTSSTLDSSQFFKIYRRATTTGTSVATSPTASAGGIYSVHVAAGGTGYTVGSTFIIDGDGTTTASGLITAVNATAITNVAITTTGSGYTTGTVRFPPGSGTGAVLYPRIAPRSGFGYDVVDDLPSFYAGFYANFAYDAVYPGSADVPALDQIRQLTLIRNPVVFNSSTGSTITYRCLKSITIGTNTGNLPGVGDIFEVTNGASSGSRGFVNYVTVSGLNYLVYYHQNSSTFGAAGNSLSPKPVVTGGTYKYYTKSSNYATATVGDSTITAVSTTPLLSTGSEEYVAGTGEVIFIQNRVPITQASGQTEAITIVTQF